MTGLIERGMTNFMRAGGLGWELETKSITFTGATPNTIGDFDGSLATAPIFTLTGDVIVRVIAVCTVTLTIDATATIEVGIAASTAGIIAQTAADAPDAKEIWHDTSPDAEMELTSEMKEFIITDGNDISIKCDTANTKTGTIAFYCFWTPLSSDGNVVAA